MSYYQSSSNNSSRYASPANYARASPQQQQYGSQTVGRRGGIPHSRPVHYSDSEEYSSDSDPDSDSDSDDEDEAPSYQRRGAVHHRPSTSSYSSSSSSRQPSHHPAPSAYHSSYQHQPQYTSQHQSAPIQRSSSPRGYMMQSNTTARMGLNMLTQPPSSQDPVASSSEDRRRPLPISSQYASSGSRYGSNASAATSGGWGSVSGSVSSASSGRSGSQGGQYVEFRPAVYPGGRVGGGRSSSGRSSRRSRR